MKDENNILKWLNRESSDKELTRLKENKDFTTLEKIAYYSSQIDVPKVNVEKALSDLKLNTATKAKKGKVVAFRTIGVAFEKDKISAIISHGSFYSCSLGSSSCHYQWNVQQEIHGYHCQFL